MDIPEDLIELTVKNWMRCMIEQLHKNPDDSVFQLEHDIGLFKYVVRDAPINSLIKYIKKYRDIMFDDVYHKSFSPVQILFLLYNEYGMEDEKFKQYI